MKKYIELEDKPIIDIPEFDWNIFQLIGKRGDIFIFDTEGFHRVNYFNEVSSDSFRMLFTQNFHIGTYGRKYSIDS